MKEKQVGLWEYPVACVSSVSTFEWLYWFSWNFDCYPHWRAPQLAPSLPMGQSPS